METKTDLQNFLSMLAGGKSDYEKNTHYPSQGGSPTIYVTVGKIRKMRFEFDGTGKFLESNVLSE